MLAIETDNAEDMIGGELGLVSRIKANNNTIFSLTCICHKLNLVMKHLVEFISSNQSEKFEEITAFINNIAGFFNMSYKKARGI